MRLPSVLCAAATICLGASTVAQAAEQVPPELAARRGGQPAPPAIPAPAELIYVPIAPCRAFSTSAPILANQTRSFQITGNGDFTSQGGPAAGCGIPASATAVAVSLHANSGKSGYLTAYAQGAAQPATSTMLVPAGVPLTTGATLGLGTTGALSVYARYGTLVAGDVTGYYAPQLWAYIGSGGSIIDSSNRVISAARVGTGSYFVTFDRDIGSCSGTASSDLTGFIISVNTSANVATVNIDDNAGAAADYWFNLHIKC